MTTTIPMTTNEVAEAFGVSASTVANWADADRLPYFRTPGGHRRFPRAAVVSMAGGDLEVGDTVPTEG